NSWCTMAIPSRCACRGLRNLTCLPATRMVPSLGFSTWESSFISVDLPAPFSPATACTSPGRMSRLTRSSACTPGKRLLTPRTSNWSDLDGYNSDSVEQDGTFAHCGGSGNTTPKYEAWYELYPAPSVNAFAVHADDIIDSSVSYANGQFTLTISDLSTGKSS